MLFSFKVKCSRGKCLSSKLFSDDVLFCLFLMLHPPVQYPRDHYVKEGNLFAHDVKADKDMHDRDNFINNISPAMDV